jgi:hypothetical protein
MGQRPRRPTLSILDLAPVPEGGNAGQALRKLLRHAEALAMRANWMAEHHNKPGIASAATAVALAHVAAGTSTIRIGAGGIMLPNRGNHRQAHVSMMVAWPRGRREPGSGGCGRPVATTPGATQDHAKYPRIGFS